jgi:hypothetical protein
VEGNARSQTYPLGLQRRGWNASKPLIARWSDLRLPRGGHGLETLGATCIAQIWGTCFTVEAAHVRSGHEVGGTGVDGVQNGMIAF